MKYDRVSTAYWCPLENIHQRRDTKNQVDEVIQSADVNHSNTGTFGHLNRDVRDGGYTSAKLHGFPFIQADLATTVFTKFQPADNRDQLGDPEYVVIL